MLFRSMFINYLVVRVGMLMTEYFGHVTETLDIWLYLEYLRVYVSMFIDYLFVRVDMLMTEYVGHVVFLGTAVILFCGASLAYFVVYATVVLIKFVVQAMLALIKFVAQATWASITSKAAWVLETTSRVFFSRSYENNKNIRSEGNDEPIIVVVSIGSIDNNDDIITPKYPCRRAKRAAAKKHAAEWGCQEKEKMEVMDILRTLLYHLRQVNS